MSGNVGKSSWILDLDMHVMGCGQWWLQHNLDSGFGSRRPGACSHGRFGLWIMDHQLNFCYCLLPSVTVQFRGQKLMMDLDLDQSAALTDIINISDTGR